MTAPLNQRQFFHGTDLDLEEGDVLHPGSQVGRANFDYKPGAGGTHGQHVWGTDIEQTAWGYAHRAYERSMEQGRTTSTPSVYKIEYEDEPEQDQDTPFVYRGSRARVVGKVGTQEPRSLQERANELLGIT
jgi:hypothetical protein